MAELNKQVAANLWANIVVAMDRFHAKIVKHEKSVFLGYADVTITIPKLEGFALKLRGIEVKNLKGNPHLDFPSERAADGTYYPHFFPKSAEMRAVLTTVLFADERIKATIEAAAQVPEATGAEAGAGQVANPFDEE